ncbi:hypothetical protein RhiirA5_445128 [Rhizophagus irregularis]|uniref:Uncharacterized protein n=1 Tax=Rhizophagus irregularis TaxID=588596 RepID=A0A2N0NCS3_9GLOM|nr:hypothetical protein RhiirA5_445128 [Rhizophagus irregularis]
MKEYVKCGEADYDLNNIFNCDKTGLYWDLEPSKTLVREKLTPFFIHTSKNLRALKDLYLERLSQKIGYKNAIAKSQNSIAG